MIKFLHFYQFQGSTKMYVASIMNFNNDFDKPPLPRLEQFLTCRATYWFVIKKVKNMNSHEIIIGIIS